VPRTHSGTMRDRNHRVPSLLTGGTTGGLRPCKPNHSTVVSDERPPKAAPPPNHCLLTKSELLLKQVALMPDNQYY
jgi:hypothetical protein